MKKTISPVIVRSNSQNAKLSSNAKAHATYVSQSTCPNNCPLRGKGCYAEYGHMGLLNMKLNSAKEKRPTMIAKAEAKGIRGLDAKYPLRLHVVGDCYNKKSAEIIAEAAGEYTAKYGKPVWTYTHNHTTPRSSWGTISVLRSCETLRQAETAIKAGFAAALIVKEFKSDKKYYIGRGLYGIPCPVQTGRCASCVECNLCMIDKTLQSKNLVVLLKTHGTGINRVNKVLDEGKK